MNKYLCLLAELDEETQGVLQMYETILLENGLSGKQTKEIPYHISLNTYSVEHESYLKDLLDNIGTKFKQINVVYSGFGLFGLNVLFLNPVMNMELLKLYEFAKEKSNSEFNVFSAHTTLFIDQPENILKILPEFVERSKKTSGNVKYISLYEFFPARLIKRIELPKNI